VLFRSLSTCIQTFAPLPNTVRGQSVHLNGDPKGTSFLYCNGRAVVIRNIDKPEICTEYTQHSAAVTVAKYAPSGFYIASGDVHGNVRIWDTVNKENILKTETRVFAGRINDLDWDHESKRIIAVGDGKDKFGHAFLFDTASSVGEISGHSKVINSVSIRQGRPFKAVTCSDDQTVNFYNGVPYKFAKSINDHTRFVQCVRFSPSGDQFVSAGMDGKIFMYDGKTGDRLSEFVGHTGGVFSVCWSADGKFLETVSADTTVKIFDVLTSQAVNTFQVSDTLGLVDDQQVGSLWQGSHILSLSLGGDINYWDRNTTRPSRVVKGHQKAITAVSVASDKTVYTGSYDGRVCAWQDNICTLVKGGHTNQVTSISNFGDRLYTTGMDDSMRIIDNPTKSFSGTTLSTGSIPKSVSACSSFTVISTLNKELIQTSLTGEKTCSVKVTYQPTVTAVSSTGNIAVGSDDGKIYVYSGQISATPSHTYESNRGSVTCLAYSPDGSLLAAGDGNRALLVFDTASRNLKIDSWCFHSAKVTCVSWSEDGKYAVSGSLDTNVEVWSVERPMKHTSIKGAHLEGVNGVGWVGPTRAVSAGQDGFVKVWDVNLP